MPQAFAFHIHIVWRLKNRFWLKRRILKKLLTLIKVLKNQLLPPLPGRGLVVDLCMIMKTQIPAVSDCLNLEFVESSIRAVLRLDAQPGKNFIQNKFFTQSEFILFIRLKKLL